MLALPLHVMSVLAVNLLVSDDCLVSRGYACELKRFFMFLWVNQHSAVTEFSYQEAVCYHNICTVSISKVMTSGSKEKPANHPFSLRHFLFFSQTFHFLFLHVALFAMFLIPPILRSHYSAVELCNGARGYQLNEFCPVASIYCAPSQMQVTLCVC